MPGEGVMNWVRNMLTMMMIGKMCSGSGAERSLRQNQWAWRNSTVFCSTLKYAKNRGIWIIIGKQPPYMLTPSVLYRDIISVFISARLGSFIFKCAYRFFSASTLG